MISLGGIIGAGLFVGSSATLSAMGPAACLSYLLAGIVVLFVMRMLGEMALANPGIGSFTNTRASAWVTGPASPTAGSTGTSGSSS
jgi:L-asparagine transporter-like permease